MPDVCRYGPALSALLDDELGGSEAEQVLAHLDGCRACADELAGLRRVRTQLRSLPTRRVPARLFGTAAAAARASEHRGRRRQAERLAIGGMMVAAALAGAVAWGADGEPARTAEVPVDVFVSDHVVRTSAGPLLTPIVPRE